jgi:rhodanese-related sulfurtransferase
LLCSVFTLGLIVSCKEGVASEEAEEESAEETTGYIDVTPEEVKDLIENNPDLITIDVSPNYANGHLPVAADCYVGDGSLDNVIPTLDKEAKYLVYCHVDSAAILGAQKLADSGFKNVYRLEGNYSGWVDAGYEAEI